MIGDPLDDVVIPDVAEPFRGFRVWRTHDGTALYSINGTEWPTDVPLEAECKVPVGSADLFAWASAAWMTEKRLAELVAWRCPGCPCPPPATSTEPGERHGANGCGIYATKSFDDAAIAYSIAEGAYVFGEIEAWGTVYEYTAGFRAQFAQPIRFWRNGNPHVDELARRYGCEVVDDFDFDRVRRLRVAESMRASARRPPVAGGIAPPPYSAAAHLAAMAAIEALRPGPQVSWPVRMWRRVRG